MNDTISGRRACLVRSRGVSTGLITVDSSVRSRCVVLDRVEVLDDSERWFGGDGEFSFAATVTFDDGDCRYHTRRVPASGYYDVAAGEERRLDTCVFEGYVAEDDEMERMILPTEADWPDSDDELTPFRQQFSGPPESWTGSYAPGDEPAASDTAPSTDCRLWYHVESVPL